MPELRHLRYFVAVAEELNFSRAAERLHMAQPPLSVAIRQLEQEIGTSLFLRTTREVRLTPAGVALLSGARRTIEQAEAAVTAAQRAAAGELGSLRIGYNWSSGFETLPALGRALSHRHPDVELLAEEMRPSRMAAALRSATIDVALALYPELSDELAYRTIRREPIVALLSSSHPLAAEPQMELQSLAEECLLFPRELAPRLHDFYVHLCRSAGFEPRQGTESSRTRLTLGTWESSTAALLPRSVSGHLPPGVVAVRISAPSEPLESQLVWRSETRNPMVAAFVELSSGVFSAAEARRQVAASQPPRSIASPSEVRE
jgi:DNA-binding transcriptional LysR family regulator